MDIQSFQRWAMGNIVENRNRGVFAEWLVGRALQAITSDEYRQEWDAWDLLYGDLKIEVKAVGLRLSLNPPMGLWVRRFGSGWPPGWCVCAGGRVSGRAGPGLGCCGGLVARGVRLRCAGALSWSDELGQVAGVLQGGGEGGCPGPAGREAEFLWLTRRAGTARSRLRMVAATVSWRAGWTPPRRAKRMRLWASTQQASQAPLAKNCPEGQRLSPDPSLRSLMASSTVAWPRW